MSAVIRALASVALFGVSLPFALLAVALMPRDGQRALGLALADVVRIMREGKP